jgi:uncharacterized membrane protein
VVRRDAKGKLHIKEVGELSPGKGMAGGAVLGAALGVLTGGATLVLGALGGVVGRIIAKRRDVGFPNQRLEQIGEALQPETSAIVAVIEHTWVTQLEDALAEEGADVMTAAISADIAEQLEAKRDVIYSALADEGVLVTERVVAGEDLYEESRTTFTEGVVETSDLIATEEGVASQHVVITEDVVAAEASIVTEDAAAYVAGVATAEGTVVAGVVAVADESEPAELEEPEAQDEE